MAPIHGFIVVLRSNAQGTSTVNYNTYADNVEDVAMQTIPVGETRNVLFSGQTRVGDDEYICPGAYLAYAPNGKHTPLVMVGVVTAVVLLHERTFEPEQGALYSLTVAPSDITDVAVDHNEASFTKYKRRGVPWKALHFMMRFWNADIEDETFRNIPSRYSGIIKMPERFVRV